MTTFTSSQTEKIENFLRTLDTDHISLMDYVTIEDIDPQKAYDSIFEMIDNKDGFQIDIIYYGTAMEYLMKNDPSLKESFEYANMLGFTLDNLNSETLASILASELEREEFAENENEINDFFSELMEEEEETEEEEF